MAAIHKILYLVYWTKEVSISIVQFALRCVPDDITDEISLSIEKHPYISPQSMLTKNHNVLMTTLETEIT